MIKIESKATKERNGHGVTCKVDMEGRKIELIYEFVCILAGMEDKQPEIFSLALDMFLKERGF